MDKKGIETETLSFVGALIISALVVIALVTVIYIIIPKSSHEDTDVPIFYYKTLVKDINELNNGIKVSSFSSNKDYALIGFSKDLKEVNVLEDKCGKVDLSQGIIKPDSCQGNACLCICEVDHGIVGFGGGLKISCNTEKSQCQVFNQNILGDNLCNYLLYYNEDKTAKELEINKNNDAIIIKQKNSKTL